MYLYSIHAPISKKKASSPVVWMGSRTKAAGAPPRLPLTCKCVGQLPYTADQWPRYNHGQWARSAGIDTQYGVRMDAGDLQNLSKCRLTRLGDPSLSAAWPRTQMAEATLLGLPCLNMRWPRCSNGCQINVRMILAPSIIGYG